MTVTLVTPSPVHHYSGMAPGFIAGLYREEELSFDLAALASAAGARLLTGHVEAVDPVERSLNLGDGRHLGYDLVSFDVGSGPAGAATPGFPEHALSVKPLSRAVAVRRRLEELAATPGDGARRVVVVGAGSAGVEVAFAAARVLDDAGVPRQITLLEAGHRILSRYDETFRRRARRALGGRRVEVRQRAPVARLVAEGVEMEEGGRLPSDLTLWLTGPAAPPLFRGSGLPLDDRGYLLVDETLRAPGHPRVFAAGDCATPESNRDTPKAGVYAVRQSPLLWRSLTLAAAGEDPARHGVFYQPQDGFLSLLNTCDGKALFSWKGFSAHARWAWWLKNWIDRRFMRRYR